MNKYLLIFFLITGGALSGAAQETYIFKDKSKLFDVKVDFEKCEADEQSTICEGEATFELLKKNQPRVIQRIRLAETYLDLGGNLPRQRVTELGGGDYRGVYFADYDFDGIEDLALSNGNYLPYGGISYNVYLYSKTARKFVFNAELSKLESEKMSVEINRRGRFIETRTKSGCCWHEKARYRYEAGGRLRKFFVFTEDATGDGKWMRLVTERLVGGRWRRSIRKVSIENYYREN